MKLTIENAVRAVRLAKYIRNGKGPLGVDLSLTNRCNFNCFFCGSRGQEPCDMDSDTIDALLHDLHKMGTKEITLSGNGEQMLHPNFWDVVDEDFKVKAVTNGSKLDEITEERFKALHKLAISLNTVDFREHCRIHGHENGNQFSVIRIEIARLLTYPNARKKLQINYVQCKYNKDEDTSYYEKKWGLKFCKRPVNLGNNPPHDILPCYAGYYGGFIESNGDYRICVHSPVVGNIIETPFAQLYQAQRLRLAGLAKGYEYCDACHTCPDVLMYSKDFNRIGRFIG
jgi:MoaA/NifB/PqqE/SkfB family radical SAM enzyme